MILLAHTITCQPPSMNLPAHGTTSPDPRSHQCVPHIQTALNSLGLEDLAWATRPVSLKLTFPPERVCFKGLTRGLAWASPTRLGEIIPRSTTISPRLGGESNNSRHPSIHDFSLRREPPALVRCSFTQNMGSSPKRDAWAQPHNYATPRLGELLSPKRDARTQTKFFVSVILT